jgi:hypothetical protein
MKLAALKMYLEKISPDGNLENEVRSTILELLNECWDSLDGSIEQAITASKLYRAENLAWTPPILGFVLERGKLSDSRIVALHYWEVNLTSGVAQVVKHGRRTKEDSLCQWMPVWINRHTISRSN